MKRVSQRVLQILNLRNVVNNLPVLRKALEGSHSQLLRIVHDVCKMIIRNIVILTFYSYQMLMDERIENIETLVCETLNEESANLKKGVCFTFSQNHVSFTCF